MSEWGRGAEKRNRPDADEFRGRSQERNRLRGNEWMGRGAEKRNRLGCSKSKKEQA